MPAIPEVIQNGPQKDTASEIVSEEENKEVLGSLNDTSSYFIGPEREVQKTHSVALLVSWCDAGSPCRHSVARFSSGDSSLHLLSFGKISPKFLDSSFSEFHAF